MIDFQSSREDTSFYGFRWPIMPRLAALDGTCSVKSNFPHLYKSLQTLQTHPSVPCVSIESEDGVL